MLREMSRNLGEQITVLEGKIYEEAKHQFNINSPQQLGKVLFDEMQLPTTRKGKNRYSTEASVLEELRPAYPFVKDILEYRQLTKIKSTYIDTLPEIINPKTGRIHTSFNQTRTSTGRLSSSDPNMQNIPVRGELGGRSARLLSPRPVLACSPATTLRLTSAPWRTFLRMRGFYAPSAMMRISMRPRPPSCSAWKNRR